MAETKRTTIVLRPEDQENLDQVAVLGGTYTTTAAIRRSLKLAREILEWIEGGGDVVLAKPRSKARLWVP